jgi:hypothetical protein
VEERVHVSLLDHVLDLRHVADDAPDDAIQALVGRRMITSKSAVSPARTRQSTSSSGSGVTAYGDTAGGMVMLSRGTE